MTADQLTPEPIRARNTTAQPQPVADGRVIAPLAYGDVDPADERVAHLLASGWLVEVTEDQEAGVAPEDVESEDTSTVPPEQVPAEGNATKPEPRASQRRKPTTEETAP